MAIVRAEFAAMPIKKLQRVASFGRRGGWKPASSLRASFRRNPQDIQILGSGTRYRVVRADSDDRRGWLLNEPACSLLLHHHISHAGIMEAKPAFEVVRADQSGMICPPVEDAGQGIFPAGKL